MFKLTNQLAMTFARQPMIQFLGPRHLIKQESKAAETKQTAPPAPKTTPHPSFVSKLPPLSEAPAIKGPSLPFPRL
jgi:hypothetical protein